MWQCQIGPGDHVFFWGSDVEQGMCLKSVCATFWSGRGFLSYHIWTAVMTMITLKGIIYLTRGTIVAQRWWLCHSYHDVWHVCHNPNTLPSFPGVEGLAFTSNDPMTQEGMLCGSSEMFGRYFLRRCEGTQNQIYPINNDQSRLSRHQAKYGIDWGPKFPTGFILLSTLFLISFFLSFVFLFSI